MRTRLIALTAILGIAALIAAPVAGATPGTTTPSGGGGSGGGGGGGHGGGGGGHAGGGGFGGGHFVGGGGRGGGFGGSVARAAYMPHGGYVAHGSYMGQHGYIAHGDYRIVGSESAGLARDDAALRGGHGGQITLSLGPRTGSAAKALRVDRVGTVGRMHGPWKHPHHRGYYSKNTQEFGYDRGWFLDCNFLKAVPAEASGDNTPVHCLGPIKEAPIKVQLGPAG
ncbi:MAG: hypothetical protein WBE91_13745 [Steroidobacteraceae bacterium]